MRLGDLDALKKAIETYDKFACLPDTTLVPFRMLNELEKNYEPYVRLRDILNAIDNATPVDIKDIYQEGHYDGHLEGYTKAINEEKPQGEWIMVTVSPDEKGGWKRAPVCNRCGYRKPNNIGQTFSNNFCPNCGARMKG